jgi:hypothetical protein
MVTPLSQELQAKLYITCWELRSEQNIERKRYEQKVVNKSLWHLDSELGNRQTVKQRKIVVKRMINKEWKGESADESE